MSDAIPEIVDYQTWRAAVEQLRKREKAATRELDAIAAQRRRLPMVELTDYTLVGANGPIRLVDVFDGRSQLIVYHHMWSDGADWQCSGCTGFTSQFTRLEFLDNYDARFVIVTTGPIEAALDYKQKVGNRLAWYSSSESPFAADMDAPPGGGFASMCSCATVTPCTARGIPRGAVPSSLATRSACSTSCRGAARRNGWIRPRVGRNARRIQAGPTPPISLRPMDLTATRDRQARVGRRQPPCGVQHHRQRWGRSAGLCATGAWLNRRLCKEPGCICVHSQFDGGQPDADCLTSQLRTNGHLATDHKRNLLKSIAVSQDMPCLAGIER